MPVINVNLIDTFDQWRIKTNTISNSFGDLDLLNTTVKSDLVSAVNEIRDTAGIQEVVEDTTPSLGGILNLNSYDITGNGNINITGIINGTINLGGDLTGTADSAQIAENTVGITELDLSDGTTGQYLTRNSSSGLSFTTLDISSESVGGDLSGTIGNAQVIPSVITGTAVGGAVNGTISSIQLNAGAVQDSHISNLDAGKISGTLAHGISSGGELGFLNKSNWADNAKETINLNHSASGIGKAVVRVYEETANPIGVITNTNDWDITTNDTGFDLENYANINTGVTPSATTGIGISFTFDNFGSGFGAGSYTSGVGYTITNTNGTGIARIDSASGLVATCTIVEDFPNTNRLLPGEFTLTAGQFIDGVFRHTKTGDTPSTDQFVLGNSYSTGDLGGRGGSGNPEIENGYAKILKTHEQTPNTGRRAVRLWSRTGTDSFSSGGNEYSIKIFETDDDTESEYINITNNTRYPTETGNDISELDMGMAGGGGDQRRVLLVGRDNNGRCKLKTYKIPAGYPAPPPDQTPQTLTFDQEEFISDISSTTKDVKIHVHTHGSYSVFYVVWQQEVTFSDNSTGYASYGKCGSIVQSTGVITMGTQHLLLDDLTSTRYSGTAAGQVNSPLLHFFKPLFNGITGDFYFCYIYYRDNGSPYAILGKLGVPGLDSTFVNSSYTLVYEVTPNQGCFRDSNNSFQPNTGPGNRLSKGHNAGFTNTDLTEQDHAIHYLGVNDAAYVWRSTLGLEACVVSLFPDQGGSDGNVNYSLLPLYFGEYTQNQSNSIKGGSAQNFDGAVATETTSQPSSANPTSGTNPIQVGSVDIAYSNAFPFGGFYQYAELSGFIPINNTLGENGAPLTGFGIEHGQSKSHVYYGTFEFNSINKTLSRSATQTNIREYDATGNINNLVSTNGSQFYGSDPKLFTAHHHGDNNLYARIHNYQTPITEGSEVSNEWVSSVTGTDTLDTTNFSILNSIIVTQEASENNVAYSFSVDPEQDANGHIIGGTFFIAKQSESGMRNIITSRNSIHGGTEGDWYINAESSYGGEDWLKVNGNLSNRVGDASQNNYDINGAFIFSLTKSFVTTTNKMTKTDVEWFSAWPELQSKFAVTIGIYSVNSASSVDKLVLNYEASAIHRDKTSDYTIDIVNTGKIEVTSPSSGGPRNARIYISS